MSGQYRRRWLQALGAAGARMAGVGGSGLLGTTSLLLTHPAQAINPYPAVLAGRPVRFPTDFGAHPEYRTEWWYLTAWLDTAAGPLGAQVTFFRSRTPYGRENPSRFAPRQLLFGHAAIGSPAKGSLAHAEQAWREDPQLAYAGIGDTDVRLGPDRRLWTIRRTTQDVYEVRIKDPAFELNFKAQPSGPPALQGQAGFSLKGIKPEQASYYYSRPHLQLNGQLKMRDINADAQLEFEGRGWLDHEWSSELLDPAAQGWDWIGINLFDGSALMAFQMRRAAGQPLRETGKRIQANSSGQDVAVTFTALRRWTSVRTGIEYPVAFRVQAGELDLELVPLMDDQELDSRGSTGAVYWEGAVTAYDYSERKNPDRQPLGRGFLEMTGYGEKIQF
ncbi:MAG: lipocalin-like domain-containing protein [Burkholderiaceae bacterium]